MRRGCLVVALLLAACTDGDGPAGSTTPSPDAGTACPTGLQAASGEDGPSCVPALPSAPCPAGSMAQLGSSECRPVGWTECPDGFAAASDGWGCGEVVAAGPCVGATMERLGSTACVPVGDCGAAWPPSDATHFVDATFTDAELDATHFRTLDEAAQATSPGAVIAVAPGSYAESVVVDHDLSLVGRCAEQVALGSDGGASPAVAVGAGATLALRGVTLSGHATCLWANAGTTVVVEDVAFDGCRDEALRAKGARLDVRRSLVRNTVPSTPGAQTVPLLAYGGATVTIDEGAFVDNVESGIGIIDVGTTATVTRTVFRSTIAQKAAGGVPIKALDGSALVVDRSLLADSDTIALLVGGPGTTAQVRRSVVRGTRPTTHLPEPTAFAVAVRLTATLELEDAMLADNAVAGLWADEAGAITARRVVVRDGRGTGWLGLGTAAVAGGGGVVSVSDSAFVQAVGDAAFADGVGSALSLERTLVQSTLPVEATADHPAGGGSGIGVSAGAHARLDVCTIADGAEVAVMAFDPESVLELSSVLVDGTKKNGAGLYGHGFVVTGGASLVVRSSLLRRNDGAALVFAGGAMGTIAASFVTENAIGVQVQDGVALVEGEGPPTPGTALVSHETAFWNNLTRVGSSAVALPTPTSPLPP